MCYESSTMNPKSVACRAALICACLVQGTLPVLGQAPPATVVTHGYQFSGTVPQWTYVMADAVAQRNGGQVYVYEGASGMLTPCQEVWCTASGAAHTVIVFDWADDSNESGAGFSEAAAEAFFAGLVAWSQQEPPLVDLQRLHLIGHSRGAIVNSEVAERLIAAGLPAPDQVTALDPHDAGGAFVAAGQAPEGGLDDFDVNREHPEYDCHAQSATPGVCAWTSVGYNDNYWQDDDVCFVLLPDGVELFGAANFNQNELDDPFCHSDTHEWYYLTVDTSALLHPSTGRGAGPGWFGTGTQCLASPRSEPLARTADGYNLSTAAGGSANRCPTGPGQTQQVLFDFALNEGIVNGDFERVRAATTQSGWSFHGGQITGSLGFDVSNHLILEAGEEALHNRFYLPEQVTALRFCRRVVAASPSDSLSITLLSPAFDDRQLLSPEQQDLGTAGDWQCFEAPLLATELGTSVQVRVSVSGSAAPTVFLDGLKLVQDVFSDGFESGDTTAWSNTIP